jgi:hypothetical protein
MLNEALRTLGIVKVSALKGMRARAFGQMMDERAQQPLIYLLDSNFTNRCPMTEMCCTTQKKLRWSSSVPSRLEPVGKTVHMLAGRTLTQLAYFELAI